MIIEHIFGTVKRKWGFNYTDLRGLPKVNGEFALIMTVYNLKRSINILGITDLLLKIKSWKPDYAKVFLALKSTVLKPLNDLYKEFGLDRTVLKLISCLNNIQGLTAINCLYGPETGFLQKSRLFFTA